MPHAGKPARKREAKAAPHLQIVAGLMPASDGLIRRTAIVAAEAGKRAGFNLAQRELPILLFPGIGFPQEAKCKQMLPRGSQSRPFSRDGGSMASSMLVERMRSGKQALKIPFPHLVSKQA
jgi:hypothetical protein